MLDRGRRDERGAAVVEAAFVLPFLVMFFAAIVDFGFILNDLQQINNATFRAVRELSVDEYSGAAGCVSDPATASDTEQLVCMVRNFSGRAAADTYVRVVPPASMTSGEQVLVCLTTRSRSITGMAEPLSGEIWLRSARHVRIESDEVDVVSHSDSLPAGTDWAWCT